MKKINKVFVIATSIVSIMMCCDDSRADLMSKKSGQFLKKNITGSNPNFAHDSIHRQSDAYVANVTRDINNQINAMQNHLHKLEQQASGGQSEVTPIVRTKKPLIKGVKHA
jgi:hypothetical protein